MKLQKAFFLVVALIFLVSVVSVFSSISSKAPGQAAAATSQSIVVESLKIINADTDTVVSDLTDGKTIDLGAIGTEHLNIQALTLPQAVGSVRFVLDTNAPRIENSAPYAYAGDSGTGDFNAFSFLPGEHTLSVTPFSGSRASGIQGQTKVVNFSVSQSSSHETSPQTNTNNTSSSGTLTNTNQSHGTQTTQPGTIQNTAQVPAAVSVSSITLMNADTNQEIKVLHDNDILDLADFGTTNLTLRADTAPTVTGSVSFDVNGTKRVENLFPYTFPAGSSDDYLPWTYELNKPYTVTAVGYSKVRATGIASLPYTLHLTVINTQSVNTRATVNLGPQEGSSAESAGAPPVTPPTIVCLNAVVTNNATLYGQANPGAISASWDAVTGYPNYKVWRLKDGQVVDGFEGTGTGIFTTHLTPGNWGIRVALLDGAPNTSAAYGGTAEITGLMVGTTYPATTNATTCGSAHQNTDSIAITAPANNTNILTNQNFTYSVSGTPSDDQILNVKFYYRGEFYPVLLGTDNNTPFSITANPGANRGFNCPSLYAVATLADGTTLRSPKVYVISTDVAATTPMANCPNNGDAPDNFDITTPVQSQSVNAGQALTITATSVGSSTLNYVKFFELGGNVAQNIATGAPGYTITSIGTKSSSPYTLSYSISTPGNYGDPGGNTNIIRAVGFYSNGKTNLIDVPIKVLPSAALPQISSLSLVNTSGASLVGTMTSGMTINIGTQANATNPPRGQNISIKANLATGSTTPGSVGFSLQSTGNPVVRYDATAPYSLFGDTSATSFTPWTQPIALGAYTLVVTPYTGANGTGTAGAAVTIPFVIVNNDDTTPPSIPSGVTTTYRSANEIRLSWTASTGAPTAYKVYRTPGTTTTLGNVTSFIDTSVTSAGSYSYSVTASDAVGNESGLSTAITPVTLPTTYAANDRVTLTSAAFPKVTPDGANAGSQQAVDSLGSIGSGGAVYYNGVFYWNVNFDTGTDGWVNQNYLAVAPAPTPSAPTNFSGVATSDTSLTISWTDNASNETGFTLNRATSANFSTGFATVTVPANTATAPSTVNYPVTGLQANTTYYFQLKANGATGDSAWATPNPLSVTTNQTPVVTGCNAGTVPANNGTKRSVQLAASVSTSPASITICWPTVSGRTVNGTITVSRRTGYGVSPAWSTLTSTLAGTATSYTDSTVTAGQYYEYKVSFSQTSTNTNSGGGDLSGTATGYISSGINVPLESYKGKIVLVVDNTFQTSLSTQIAQLIDDLNGDRWAVLGPVYVNRTDAPSAVRTQIQNLYNANSNVKAVYLLGHVPVPYFGSMSVDGHASRGTSGDAYYGEMDSTWNSVASGCSGFSWAPVNAGTIDTPSTSAQFCNTTTPSNTELQVGRVDMYQMPSFGGNEATLLGNYLTKAHNFKIRQFIPNETAYIKDGFNGPNGSQNGPLNYYNGRLAWATFPSLVGAGNITVNNALSPTLDATLNGQNYEFVYGASGGASCQGSADGAALGSTGTLATTQWGGVFNQMLGSYFGEWGCSDSFLRAPTLSGIGLTNLYSGQRYVYLHSMAMGQNIGYGQMISVNNTTSLYDPVGGIWGTSYPGNAYMTLIGDPSLRMTYLAKPASLTPSNVSNQVAFAWASVSGAEGYNIYEIQANSVQTNTVRKVNPVLITGTSYTSTDTYTAGKKYMVTAVKTKTSVGGTYLNESLGTLATLGGQVQTDTNAPSAPSGLISTAQTTTSITLDWTDSTGNPTSESVFYKVYRNAGGATAINETTPIATGLTTSAYTDSGLTSGTNYSYKVSAYDAIGNESTHMPTTGYTIATSTAPDTTAPSVPSGLSVSGATSSTLSMSWTASTDNVGVVGYKVYRSTSATGTYAQIATSTSTTYTDTSLSSATTYYYKLGAYDLANNNSAQSASVSGTTAAASGTGQVAGLLGGTGPNNSEDVTPTANPYGVTDYFIDCTAGNDANNGTTISTPWKTMAKFNSSGAGSLQPGARVFIKRGGVCYGPTTVIGQYGGVIDSYRSGTASQYVEYKAYGSGNAPVISGATPVTNWTAYSGSIYKANIGANKNPRYLFVNNTIQTLARTPNRDASGNNVFLTTDDMNGQSGPSTYITDAGMPNSSTTNLNGGSVFYRHDNFTWVTAPITAHSGTTLTLGTSDAQCYSPHCSSSIYPAAGWGYIIENKLSLLDTPGEWYYDKTTGDVYLWAAGGVNPNTLTVEASIQINGMYLATNLKYVRVKNLVFEKFNYTPYGSAINLNDYSGAPGVSNNSIENVEVRNSFIGIRNQTNSTDPTKANSVINSYLHDLYSIGIYSYGYGHLYQGNVIENIAMRPEYAADTSTWGYFFGVYSLGGEPKLISNILRNIGYIGINHVGNGEMRGNLLENTSMTLNDGCGICADGANNNLSVKRNVVKGIFGNLDAVPSTFVHATALGSGISTGDRSSIGGVFEENVVTDFGNAGITLDNNFLSNNMTVKNNTVYTNIPGNSVGAAGLKFMDQSVGVSHPPAGSPCSTANNGCYVANFNHQIFGNKVYTLHANNHTMYFLYTLTNGTNSVDYGNFYNNYLFDPTTTSSITEDRRWVGVKTNDLVTIRKNQQTGASQSVNIYTSANAASTVVGQHASGDKGTIVGASQVGNGINWWYVNFSTGVDGYVQEYNLELAPRTVAEWQSLVNEPPSGQLQNKSNAYLIANQANNPSIYFNDTASAKTVSIGSGKCDKDKNPLSSSVTLTNFADAIVPETCADQP